MASIRKSFSFRNGVQVDEDNFIVNANAWLVLELQYLTKLLDVRGTAKVVGLTTTNDLFVVLRLQPMFKLELQYQLLVVV